MPSRPSKATTNRLWGLCGNECANPNCETEVLSFDLDSEIVEKTGEVAHIKGAKEGSNRYDASQSDEERHSFDNLLVLCPACHTQNPDGVDIPANETRFPARLLLQWKTSHQEKVLARRDRNWVCSPNMISEMQGEVSIETRYWIDSKGRAQLYTPEHLAIVTQLFPLVLSFSQISALMGVIEQTEGKPADPSHQTLNDGYINVLYKDKQRIKANDYGWIGYLTETMQIAQDVTLGELFLMMVNNGLRDRDTHVAEGKRMLKELAKETDPLPKRRPIERR